MQIDAKTLKLYRGKSEATLSNLAQVWFNKYIRYRDMEDGWFRCISCMHTKAVKQMHAGHYMSAGKHTALRLNENNCHLQCIQCNKYLHGNLNMYRINLVNKIGLPAVLLLEAMAGQSGKMDKYSLITLIEKYKSECRRLEIVKPFILTIKEKKKKVIQK